jgi:hypothetical protein
MFVCFLLFLSLLQIRCGEQAQTGAVSICEGNQIKYSIKIQKLTTKKNNTNKIQGGRPNGTRSGGGAASIYTSSKSLNKN